MEILNLSFSPLAGIRYAETSTTTNGLIVCHKKFQSPCGDQICGNLGGNSIFLLLPLMGCFSPLAGIRYAETCSGRINQASGIVSFQSPCGDQICGNRFIGLGAVFQGFVSVPLRGLDMRKLFCLRYDNPLCNRFSPLAGIRYAETASIIPPSSAFNGFSPLAGIRYAETGGSYNSSNSHTMFQSPCGDQICGNPAV